jgi:hypothetical protein
MASSTAAAAMLPVAELDRQLIASGGVGGCSQHPPLTCCMLCVVVCLALSWAAMLGA